MKNAILLFSVVLAAATSAFAYPVQVSESPEQLYKGLVAAFPEALSGGNHSQDFILNRFACTRDSRFVECSGFTMDGQILAVSDEDTVISLLAALKQAGIAGEGREQNWVTLENLSCSHVMPSDSDEYFECTYIR